MPWYYLLLFLAFFGLTLGSNNFTIVNSKNGSERQKKLFSLFSLVSFPNTQCTLLSTANSRLVMFGICRSPDECSNVGGVGDGACAAGFGVCCMLSVSSCQATISQNLTYIQSPNFPSGLTTTGTCPFSFTANPDICQIRLDFDIAVLSQPSTAVANLGQCTDKLTVTSPSGFSPPVVCGTLSGTHMYFETARATNAGSFSVFTNPAIAGTPARSWKIRVSYIECFSESRAPVDCTQYFTGTSGFFQSYNFQPTTGRLLTSQNYNYCFRQEEGYCTLDVTPVGAQTFRIDTISGALIGTATCTIAHVQINTLPSMVGISPDNFCGNYLNELGGSVMLNGIVTDNESPFVVGVFTRNPPLGAQFLEGFNLAYMQMAC